MRLLTLLLFGHVCRPRSWPALNTEHGGRSIPRGFRGGGWNAGLNEPAWAVFF